MRAAQLGFQKPPAVKSNPEFEANKEANSGHVEDMPDFTQLMQSSNAEREKELEKERNATAGGQLNLGETKSDKDFREMLEKMTGKKQDKIKNKLDKDDYLNLMVTQLKHQDPTKPMDNQEMAQQLAQFNTVEQLISANQTLQKMANSQSEAKIDKLSPFLGKTIQVGGNKVRMNEEGKISSAYYEIPEDSSTMSMVIKDSSGRVVRSDSETGAKKGEHVYKWDGRDDKGNKMASGEYTITIEGTTMEGKPLKAKQTFTAKVTEITDLASGGKLGTSVGTVETKDILAIKADEPVLAAAEDAKHAAATAAQPAATTATAPAPKNAADAAQKATQAADEKAPQAAQADPVESKLAEHKARRKAAAEAKKAAAAVAPATKVTEAGTAAAEVTAKAAESAKPQTQQQTSASKKDASKTESSKNDSKQTVEKNNETKKV